MVARNEMTPMERKYHDGYRDAISQMLGQFALGGTDGMLKWLRDNAPGEVENIVQLLAAVLATADLCPACARGDHKSCVHDLPIVPDLAFQPHVSCSCVDRYHIYDSAGKLAAWEDDGPST